MEDQMVTGRLSEVPNGLSVFVDANIFIYHFSGPTPLSPACSAFLGRIEGGAIRGLTSTIVLVEVLHRLMILEAAGVFQLPPRDALRHLKEHPQEAKKLLAHQTSVSKIREMGVEVVLVGVEDILRSNEIKQQHGLLTNDAILVAVMERLGASALASNDPDFQTVGTITLYRPTLGE
jgi:predicted nucleic acid-binding protein